MFVDRQTGSTLKQAQNRMPRAALHACKSGFGHAVAWRAILACLATVRAAFLAPAGTGMSRLTSSLMSGAHSRLHSRRLVMTESGDSFRLPTPPRIKQTQNWRDAAALSKKFADEPVDQTKRKRVAIIGGGLSGLSCAKYLADAGHIPVVVSEMHTS